MKHLKNNQIYQQELLINSNLFFSFDMVKFFGFHKSFDFQNYDRESLNFNSLLILAEQLEEL